MYFSVAFHNVFLALVYMAPGFFMQKKGMVSSSHLPSLSAILIYIGTPILEISAFLSMEYSKEGLAEMGMFFLITVVLQALFIGIIALLCRKKMKNPKVRMTVVGTVTGNVGFFGMTVIRGIFPQMTQVSSYVAMFVVSMNVMVFTIGAYCITGKKEFMSFRSAFLNPAIYGLLIGFPIYFFNLGGYIPDVVKTAVNNISGITMPLCMFVLGVRLASKPIARALTNPTVYMIVFLKMIVFPVISYYLVSLLPLPDAFRYTILIICGTPCAAVLLSLAEMHDGEKDLAADCILISTVCSVFTIPCLTLLL